MYKLLLVENEQHAAALREACRSTDEVLVAVHTIRSAIDFIETKDHVNVILAAAHLEHESVFDFLHMARNSEHLRDVPFIMFCAEPGEVATHFNSTVEKLAYKLGADKYLMMPTFDADLVLAEVEKLKSAKE
jgi:CheY-like chemotaxis protein